MPTARGSGMSEAGGSRSAASIGAEPPADRGGVRGHLANRYKCLAYPQARHEEVRLTCDKCGREWAVDMAKLRAAVEDADVGKVGVAEISRRWTPTGGP